METSTKKLASMLGLAVLMVIAAGGLAMAVDRFAQPVDRTPGISRVDAPDCAGCATDGAIPARWEIAKDAKIAEPMPTF